MRFVVLLDLEFNVLLHGSPGRGLPARRCVSILLVHILNLEL
jgi:hypothetical protein